ncbi:MAG: BC1881 family protein [Eubacterium sp.]
MELKDVKTCELVEELKNREGISHHWAEPYENKDIKVNGPALVLVVID